MIRIGHYVAWICLGIACSSGLPQAEASEPPAITAGVALEVMFDEHRTSRAKSRALLQRKTFVDLVEQSHKQLQIAFVVDGTDSMGNDIQGVLKSLQPMVENLIRHKDNAQNVSYTLVIYRDTGAPSGKVVFPLGTKFTQSVDELQQAVAQTKTETGLPYFPELIDLGIHEAIETLDWREDQSTSRWILVFGDAPPYGEGFRDEEQNTQRFFTTNEIIAASKQHAIKVSFVLCHSGFVNELSNENPKLAETYQKALPRSREFMEHVAKETGGVWWDLTDPDLRKDLLAAIERDRVQYQRLDGIKPSDVMLARANANREGTDEALDARVRMAVLPHMPLTEMSFAADDYAVQVATELRHKLRLIPHVEVVNAEAVADKFGEIRESSVPTNQWLQKLAMDVRADYMLWGSYQRTGEQVELRSAVYKRVDGTMVAEAVEMANAAEMTREGNEMGETSLVSVVADRLMRNFTAALQRTGADEGLVSTFASVNTNEELGNEFASPLSTNVRALRELLSGFELAELALAHPKGSLKSAELLDKAVLKLGAAKALDQKNPLIYMTLASCYFNLAKMDMASGDVQSFFKSLERAYVYRENTTHQAVRTEIEADYSLLIRKDIGQALTLYQSLLGVDQPARLNSALRAHWMMAGVYCGDWDVPSEYVNSRQAREHIIEILAQWEDSPEAKFYKDAFKWNEDSGTERNYVPRDNSEIGELARSN